MSKKARTERSQQQSSKDCSCRCFSHSSTRPTLALETTRDLFVDLSIPIIVASSVQENRNVAYLILLTMADPERRCRPHCPGIMGIECIRDAVGQEKKKRHQVTRPLHEEGSTKQPAFVYYFARTLAVPPLLLFLS
jgi:hypothetical protein